MYVAQAWLYAFAVIVATLGCGAPKLATGYFWERRTPVRHLIDMHNQINIYFQFIWIMDLLKNPLFDVGFFLSNAHSLQNGNTDDTRIGSYH